MFGFDFERKLIISKKNWVNRMVIEEKYGGEKYLD